MKRFFIMVLTCSLALLPQGTAAAGLTDNGNGTVTDTGTGLVWQQDEPGVMALGGALAYCNSLSLGGHSDWRLPSVSELESLTDDTRWDPALDKSFFPNAFALSYWSSTTDAGYSPGAWVVGFYLGHVFYTYKDFDYYVRCVRGGQSGALGTLSLNVSGTGSGVVSGNGFSIGESVVFSTSAGTSEPFDMDTGVNLNAAHLDFSQFTGWSGACTGTAVDCVLTMDADKSVTVTFDRDTAHQVLIDSTNYPTIMGAYQAAVSGKQIFIWALNFSEDFTFKLNKAVTIAGGYDSSYSSNNGYTTLTAPFTIQSGSLTVENLVIK